MAEGDTTPPAELSMTDCKQSDIGAVVGGSQALLQHGGDYIILVCPAVAGSVNFNVVRYAKVHIRGMIGTDSPSTTGRKSESFTLKTGETKKIGPVIEQQDAGKADSGNQYNWAMGQWSDSNGTLYIDDMDITVAIASAKGLDGSSLVVNNKPIQYFWSCYKDDGTVLASGVELSQSAAEAGIDAYVKEHEGDTFQYKVVDASGKPAGKAGVHKPTGGDFPWVWLVGGILVVAAIVIVYYFFVHKRAGAPAATPTAAAPAPAVAPPVTVINTGGA